MSQHFDEHIELLTPLQDVLGHMHYQIDAFYAHERLSELTRIIVKLRAFDKVVHPCIKESLKRPIALKLMYHETERFFYGYIGHIHHTPMQDHDLYQIYELTLYPHLWFQTFTQNYQIFQNQTPQHIIHHMMETYTHTELIDHSITYGRTQNDYTVQYGESHLKFIQRLMAEEGFFYRMDHDQGRNTLHIFDDVTQLPFLNFYHEGVPLQQAQNKTSHPHTLQFFNAEYAATAHQYACADYAYTTPHTRLFIKTLSDHPEPGLIYQYPGYFQTLNDGEHRAKHLRTQCEWVEHIHNGRSTASMLQPGYKCIMRSHDDTPQHYTMLDVHHFWARNPSIHLTSYKPMAYPADQVDTYYNYFSCIPAHVEFAPDPMPKPIVPAHQSARVVGPKGEDIYTDSMGRIKIQFFWDQSGQFNEHSSCWVRVCQSLSGSEMGSYYLPRVGCEVIVSFLNGDINQPVVVGCVYNADDMPPLDLPQEKEHHIFKTRSPQTHPIRYNEWRIVDTPYREKIYMRAQHDYTLDVMDGSYTQTVYEGDETRTLEKGHFTHRLKHGDYHVTLHAGTLTQAITSGHSVHTLQQGNYDVRIEEGSHLLTIQKGDTRVSLAEGSCDLNIQKGNLSITVGDGGCNVHISGQVKLTTDHTLDIKSNTLNLVCAKDLNIKAENIKVSGDKFSIDTQSDVSITGAKIKIEAQSELSLKGNPLTKSGEA